MLIRFETNWSSWESKGIIRSGLMITTPIPKTNSIVHDAIMSVGAESQDALCVVLGETGVGTGGKGDESDSSIVTATKAVWHALAAQGAPRTLGSLSMPDGLGKDTSS